MNTKTKSVATSNSRAIIFLDIDGVVNTYNHLKAQVRNTGTNSHENWCPKACRNLGFLANIFRAKIVISSSWRHGRTIQDFRSIFQSNGLDPNLIIDKTPNVAELEHVWLSDPFDEYCRGHEIEEWLLVNEPDCNYIIIDDDEDMLTKQKDRFVRVDSEVGFADFTAFNKAIDILSNERSQQAKYG